MHEPKKILLSLGSFFSLLLSFSCSQALATQSEQVPLNISSKYIKENSSYVTEGSLSTTVPIGKFQKIAFDLPGYRDWAIEKINEKPDGGAFIINITDLRGQNKTPTLTIIYDIHLPWPFNLKAETISLSGQEGSAAASNSLELSLGQPTATLKELSAKLKCTKEGQYSRLFFRFDIRLNPMLNLFFTEALYRKNVEARILRVMSNLRHRVESFKSIESVEGLPVIPVSQPQ